MKRQLRNALRKTLHTVEIPWDAAKRRVKRRLNLYSEIKIFPYRGFGNRQRCHVLGRVLENRDVGTAAGDDPWWKNSLAMIRRFRTDEIPFCDLEGTLLGQTRQATTDSEGYFRINFEKQIPTADSRLWHDVDLKLLEEVVRGQPETTAAGRILVPPEEAQFGVISDIDDTILQSSATDIFRLAKLTFFNNAYTRTPFPKVARFYQALQRGAANREPVNPIFYVSSSAWNIYDLLDEFMRIQHIPEGPILLRDLGLDSNKLLKSGHEHKLEKIAEILDYYPRLPFILIGDSGQRDAWLYRDAVHRFPGRVAAIYIRDVKESRREPVNEIAAELEREGVVMLLMEDAAAAAEHAVAEGMIAEEAYRLIAE